MREEEKEKGGRYRECRDWNMGLRSSRQLSSPTENSDTEILTWIETNVSERSMCIEGRLGGNL